MRIFKKLMAVAVIALTLFSVVNAVEIDDPYPRSYVVKLPVTTFQMK